MAYVDTKYLFKCETCRHCIGDIKCYTLCDHGEMYIPDISKIPAADVEEVKHGEWIEDGEYQICSVCGEEHHWDEYRATYCEDCGAKMDGGKAV